MWWWLRRLVRRSMRPIPVSTAEKWDFRLSLLYVFFAWNAAGLILYMTISGKDLPGVKDDRPPSVKFAELLKVDKAHVYQVSGFRKVGEFDIDLTNKDENEDEE